MFARAAAIAFNTYREAVRARVLHGMFALALGTGAYSVVVGAFALGSKLRVVSDLGAAAISLFGVIVAVVLSATSLHRELELKTIFPILARPIRRHEYLVGKFAGTLLTLLAFVAAYCGALLLAISALAGSPLWQPLIAGLGGVALVSIAAWRWRRLRTWAPLIGAVVLLAAGMLLSGVAPDERRVLVGLSLLTLFEVSIVAAIATLFASFSSPFLSAILTLGVFVVGRSADYLARLPARVFGQPIHDLGALLSQVLPNLMVYVPPRPLLTGEQGAADWPRYWLMAGTQAAAWAVALLAVSALLFRRRDFL